jgi:hypothetical protein
MTISVLINQTEARGFVPGGCAIFAVPVFEAAMSVFAKSWQRE